MAVDPQRIAAAYYSGEIGVWDRRGNRLTSYRLFHGNAYQHGFFWPALSPDGSLVAYQHAGGQNLHVIKVSDRKEIRTLPRIPGGSGAFSPDDTRVAYFSPHGEARITTLSDGHTISLAGADRGASCGGYTAPSFTPDGRLVGASTFCGDIAIWNAATGRLTRLIKSPDVVFSAIAFSHDGSRVAWGSTDTTISVASLRTGKRVEVLHGQPGSVASVTFSLDDRRVVTAGLDRTVRVWDLKTGRTLRVVPGPDFAPLVTPDGKDIVATDHTGTVSAIPVCPSCGQAKALLTVAATRITRTFTTQERKLFLNGF
jgi:WD40 repeat protein